MIHSCSFPTCPPTVAALFVALISGGCDTDRAGSLDRGTAELAVTLARQYVDAYFEQFPEEAAEAGYPDAPQNRFSDLSPASLTDWRSREDAWLEELRSIDRSRIDGSPAAIPYDYARWRLEASQARRACRMESWTVSPTYSGWQSILPAALAVQPVGSDLARADAIARVNDVVRYLEVEIANLRSGLDEGHSAPKSNVLAVLKQVDELLATRPDDSPFFDPAARDGSEEFAGEMRRVLSENVYPAIARYREFLAGTYLDAARDDVGVTANTDGAECYRASVQYYTSLPLRPEEIHESGLEQMERIHAQVREIGARNFGVSDPGKVFAMVQTEPEYLLRGREEILAYARNAVDRAKQATPDWFGFVPQSEVVVKEFPAFQKRCGGGFYSAGDPAAGRPGTYELGTDCPDGLTKAGLEATAFHESYPGHHLQVAVALEREGTHPVLQYFFFSGTGEGWALYTERLADEMGLYSSDVDRVGLLSNEALRAARLVVDPGMHVLGWTRQQAIDYMVANTAMSRAQSEYQIDRYIATPAQATSYMTGSLEIMRLRAMAEQTLGDDFDIKSFHDAVIEDGTVTLGMLREKIERWIAEKQVS